MRPVCVFKVGGSLFDLPELSEILAHLSSLRPNHTTVFVAGGGRAADAIREWDRIHQLGEENSHWLALAAMQIGEGLLTHLLPGVRTVHNAEDFAAKRGDRRLILNTFGLIAHTEGAGQPTLPHTWDVTSDSLAAWGAGVLGAEELVLIKSVPAPTRISAGMAAEMGLVDTHFPHVAVKVAQIGWVNGREREPSIEAWLKWGKVAGDSLSSDARTD